MKWHNSKDSESILCLLIFTALFMIMFILVRNFGGSTVAFPWTTQRRKRVSMMQVLLTSFAPPASLLLLFFLHKKEDESCFDFLTGIQTLPEVESLNLCEILEPYFPHRRMHCSGHIAVASASGGLWITWAPTVSWEKISPKLPLWSVVGVHCSQATSMLTFCAAPVLQVGQNNSKEWSLTLTDIAYNQI